MEQENPLELYTTNLTDLAQKGKLDPVIGRDNEIRRVIQILSRRTKNNPVLLGDPGVGKTETAKALAETLFNDERALIRIDMTEYQEPYRQFPKHDSDLNLQSWFFISGRRFIQGGKSGQSHGRGEKNL